MTNVSSAHSLNENIHTCSICTDLFQEPKILPKCGHTFCLHCLQLVWEHAFVKWNITCPICREESPIDPIVGPQNLTTNYHARHTVEALKDAGSGVALNGGFSKQNETEDHCSHATATSNLCRHCERKFCEPCLLGHKERLKFEIIWQSSELDERLGFVTNGLSEAVSNMTNTIIDNSQQVEDRIRLACQHFQDAIIAAVGQHGAALLDEAKQIANIQLQKVGRLVEEAEQQRELIARQIAQVNDQSVLHWPHDDIVSLYSNLKLEQETKVSKLEFLKTRQDPGRYAFNSNLTLDYGGIVMRLTSPIQSSVLCWSMPDRSGDKLLTKEQRLHDTALKGDITALKKILERKCLSGACRKFLLEHRDKEDCGRTLLIQASTLGHLEYVEFLVRELGANVEAQGDDVEGMMAIHAAAEQGQIDVVKFLIRFKTEQMEAKTKTGLSPIFIAVRFSRFNVARYLVEVQKVQLECRDDKGRTPLLEAALKNNFPVVKLLASNGANLTAKDVNGDTAVHLAIASGQSDMAKYLIDLSPAVLHEKNNKRQTPFKLAKAQKTSRSMPLLIFFEHVKNLKI